MELQARHDDNAAWSACDRYIGLPVRTKNAEGIKVYYDRAREFHGRGIKMLEAEFASHRSSSTLHTPRLPALK